eukprot:2863992-Amphidinium_carterae.1
MHGLIKASREVEQASIFFGRLPHGCPLSDLEALATIQYHADAEWWHDFVDVAADRCGEFTHRPQPQRLKINKARYPVD